jgi:hypothetical protein
VTDIDEGLGMVRVGTNQALYNTSRFEICTAFNAHVVPAPPTPEVDLKFDGGKPKWSLLLSAKGMLAALGGVVNVLTFGAKKYKEHSWRTVADNERRYMDALIRHLIEIQTHGLDARDKESGELHIDHVNCNGLFLAELARK